MSGLALLDAMRALTKLIERHHPPPWREDPIRHARTCGYCQSLWSFRDALEDYARDVIVQERAQSHD